jgi:predicted nucleotidyltransferase
MNAQQKVINTLCQRYDVQAMYVFGSRATEVLALIEGSVDALVGCERDVDIAILTGSPLSVEQKVELSIALEDTLGAPRVDLVVLNNADPFLAANAIRGYRLYARDSYEADEYELYVLRRAGDLAPFERKRIAMIMGDK